MTINQKIAEMRDAAIGDRAAAHSKLLHAASQSSDVTEERCIYEFNRGYVDAMIDVMRMLEEFGSAFEGYYEKMWRDECEAGKVIRKQRDDAYEHAAKTLETMPAGRWDVPHDRPTVAQCVTVVRALAEQHARVQFQTSDDRGRGSDYPDNES